MHTLQREVLSSATATFRNPMAVTKTRDLGVSIVVSSKLSGMED